MTNDRKHKYLGLDIEIKNLFALFVDDESTHRQEATTTKRRRSFKGQFEQIS